MSEFFEEEQGVEKIGDRDVTHTRHFDEKGHSWTEYGDGPGYLCHYPRQRPQHRWSPFFDYRKAVIDLELAHRTKGDGKEYYSAVETVHKILANDARHQVAGSGMKGDVVRLRKAVLRSVRELDSGPLRKIADAIDAVRWVDERGPENDNLIGAIAKAARSVDGVPFRSEVKLFLSGKDQHLSAPALADRLQRLGFGWLPGGRARKVKVRKKLT